MNSIRGRQITAYLLAVAYQDMANRGVDTVDDLAIKAIMEDAETNDAQKAVAIQQLLEPVIVEPPVEPQE